MLAASRPVAVGYQPRMGFVMAVSSAAWIGLAACYALAVAQWALTLRRARTERDRSTYPVAGLAAWIGAGATALVWFLALRPDGMDADEYLLLLLGAPVAVYLAIFPAAAVAVAARRRRS